MGRTPAPSDLSCGFVPAPPAKSGKFFGALLRVGFSETDGCAGRAGGVAGVAELTAWVTP